MLLSERAARAPLLLVAMMALIAQPAYASWQEMPDAVKLQAVGDNLLMNGTPMQIRAFVSDMPVETILREVEGNWERRPGSSTVTRVNTAIWAILNQTVGDQHRSLQVRQSGPSTSEGFVALTSPKLARTPKMTVRLPPEMTAVSVIDSVDQGRISQQVIAVSRRSVDASAMALESALKADGWERHVFKKNGDAVRLAANKGNQQFDATLSGQKSGSIVMMSTLKN